MKRMPTPKQRVLKKHPKAYARFWKHSRAWNVSVKIEKPMPQHVIIGRGETEDEAWADAARRLRGKK